VEIGDGATGEKGWRWDKLVADAGKRNEEFVTVLDPRLVLIINDGKIAALDG